MTKPFDFTEQNRKLLAAAIQQNSELRQEIKRIRKELFFLKDCIKDIYEKIEETGYLNDDV